MATKFSTMNEAIKAAKAYNLKERGEHAKGYQLSQTREIYDGFELIPGFWTVYCRNASGQSVAI